MSLFSDFLFWDHFPTGKTWTRFVECLLLVRHSRVGGNPVITRTPLDSRLRGNGSCAAQGTVCVAHGERTQGHHLFWGASTLSTCGIEPLWAQNWGNG
jgi:hypothetical protein